MGLGTGTQKGWLPFLLLFLFARPRREEGPFSGGAGGGPSLPAPGVGSGEDDGKETGTQAEASGRGGWGPRSPLKPLSRAWVYF